MKLLQFAAQKYWITLQSVEPNDLEESHRVAAHLWDVTLEQPADSH